jgi:hypothetical protein
MPMIGIYPVLGLGIPLPIWRTETGGSFNRFDRELYNEIEKSIQAGFQRKSF